MEYKRYLSTAVSLFLYAPERCTKSEQMSPVSLQSSLQEVCLFHSIGANNSFNSPGVAECRARLIRDRTNVNRDG